MRHRSAVGCDEIPTPLATINKRVTNSQPFRYSSLMNRADVLRLLTTLKPQLQAQFGVRELALFGSAARDELRPDSDVDVLVKFDVPATSSRYFGVQFAIEDALAMPVDLVTHKALRAELRPYVERDRIRV
jgi:uncharacterized protein